MFSIQYSSFLQKMLEK